MSSSRRRASKIIGPEVAFDVAISRAFADLTSFWAAAGHLVRPGGCLIAMKGEYPHAELGQLPA